MSALFTEPVIPFTTADVKDRRCARVKGAFSQEATLALPGRPDFIYLPYKNLLIFAIGGKEFSIFGEGGPEYACTHGMSEYIIYGLDFLLFQSCNDSPVGPAIAYIASVGTEKQGTGPSRLTSRESEKTMASLRKR